MGPCQFLQQPSQANRARISIERPNLAAGNSISSPKNPLTTLVEFAYWEARFRNLAAQRRHEPQRVKEQVERGGDTRGNDVGSEQRLGAGPLFLDHRNAERRFGEHLVIVAAIADRYYSPGAQILDHLALRGSLILCRQDDDLRGQSGELFSGLPEGVGSDDVDCEPGSE